MTGGSLYFLFFNIGKGQGTSIHGTSGDVGGWASKEGKRSYTYFRLYRNGEFGFVDGPPPVRELTHEMLHTLGATDLYSTQTGKNSCKMESDWIMCYENNLFHNSLDKSSVGIMTMKEIANYKRDVK